MPGNKNSERKKKRDSEDSPVQESAPKRQCGRPHKVQRDDIQDVEITDYQTPLPDKSLENVQITKKHKYSSKVDTKYRCTARTWNNGAGGRCKRSQNENELCTLHNNYKKEYGKLKYGLITEPKPKDVFKFKNPKSEKLY